MARGYLRIFILSSHKNAVYLLTAVHNKSPQLTVISISVPMLLNDFVFFCSPSNRFWVMVSPFGASKSHVLCTPDSVWLPWASDQLVTETCTPQHKTHTTDRHPRPPMGFEPAIPAIERPQTHASDPVATGTNIRGYQNENKRIKFLCIFSQYTVANNSAVPI